MRMDVLRNRRGFSMAASVAAGVQPGRGDRDAEDRYVMAHSASQRASQL
jgi:hypothetical protein